MIADSTKTPVFVKQLGTYLSKKLGLKNRSGADMSEWPSSVQFSAISNYLPVLTMYIMTLRQLIKEASELVDGNLDIGRVLRPSAQGLYKHQF